MYIHIYAHIYGGLAGYMSVYHVNTLCLWRPEEEIQLLGTGVTEDDCELPCGGGN